MQQPANECITGYTCICNDCESTEIALNKNGKGSKWLPGAGLTTGQGQSQPSTSAQSKHKVSGLQHVELSDDLQSWKCLNNRNNNSKTFNFIEIATLVTLLL